MGAGASVLTDAPTTSARPHVLFLINDLRMGGAERSLVNFVNHVREVRPSIVLIETAGDLLAELSGGPDIFSLEHRDPAPLLATELQSARAAAVAPRRGRPPGQTAREIPELIRKARTLARLSRDTNATLVSTFLNRSHTIAILAKLLFAPRLRIVINVHEMLSDHLDRFFSSVERVAMRGFIQHGFPRAHAIVAVSEGVKQDLVRHFSIAPARITVIPNPVHRERIRRLAMDEIESDAGSSASMTVVSVGRLVPLKGFDLLIRAFAKLRPTLPARLLIVGEGDQRVTLETLITELNLSDRVALVGTQANPWKYMARADVVALASRSEAFPNVIGEALALGRPVIATECSAGVAEYLDGGRYGVLVPPDDVDALAAGLDELLSNEALRRRLIANAASRVDAFDIERIVDRYQTLLLEAAHA